MHSITLEYTDLSSAALVKIFQLLGITPKDAAKVYLSAQAKKAKAAKATFTNPHTA